MHHGVSSRQHSDRRTNDDAWGAFEAGGVYCVVDGDGGWEGPATAASDALLSVLHAWFSTSSHPATHVEPLAAALQVAHQRVAALEQAGVTMAAVRFVGSTLVTAHVGNCRVLRHRDGVLERLTHDHTLVANAHKQGESVEHLAALHALHPNLVTRVLGVGTLALDVQYLEVQAGEVIVLCTDGVTRALDDPRITTVLTHEGSIQARCDALTRLAVQHGKDNATALIISVD